MIYLESDCCPKTKEEAFKLQEQTVYLHYHIKLVKQAIDILQERYFDKTEKFILNNEPEQYMFLLSYESIQKQIEIAATLIDDCIEFIAVLRGEENIYTNQTDEIIASRNKIRELLLEE